MEELGVSLATFKRDLEFMRDRFNAPIIWDSETRGYRWGDGAAVGPKFQLPGLWFNEQELLALSTMQYLLSSIAKDGLIAQQLEPLMERLNSILGQDDVTSTEIRKRVQLLSTTTRKNDLVHFKTVGSALVNRKRIEIAYGARGSDNQTTDRVLSPQRLIHYRNNWYLSAWCHTVDDLRTFSLDAIAECEVLDVAAKDISDKKLVAYHDNGYGIFGGAKRYWAKLKFNANAARYVDGEIWHVEQRSRYDRAGNYHLEVPYSSAQELVMDVLRHGAEVEVLGSSGLRQEIKNRVDGMSALYL